MTEPNPSYDAGGSDLEREGAPELYSMSVCIPVPGNPRPKSRPRVVNGRAYTPKATAEYERYLRDFLAPRWERKPLTEPLSVQMYFYRDTRRRVDLDNLIKSVLDAMQGLVFVDDYQIVRISAEKRYDAEFPRVEVTISNAGGWKQGWV
jgi:Holliday junction resolvase RusA-like endonuclease